MRFRGLLLLMSTVLMSLPPVFAAAEEVYLVESKHQIFGEQRIYVAKDFFRIDLEREGTTFVRRKNDKDPYMFNRKKKVYFRGSNSGAMKSADLMAFVSGKGDATLDWGKVKWKIEGNGKIAGTACRCYSHQGSNLWKVWVCDFPGVDRSLYKDHLEWSKAPKVGGLPLRMLVISKLKSGGEQTVVAFNTQKVSKTKMDLKELDVPEGSKRVTNLFELSSNRTSQLMDEFSTILGD